MHAAHGCLTARLTPVGETMTKHWACLGSSFCLLLLAQSKLQDNLFVLVEKYKICILECDATTGGCTVCTALHTGQDGGRHKRGKKGACGDHGGRVLCLLTRVCSVC